MAEEGALRFAEYTVAKRAKGKNLAARIALIAAYALFAAGYCVFFTTAVLIPQVIAVLPVLLWIAVFFTWRLVRYEITVKLDSGKFTVSRGGKRAPVLFARPAKEATGGGNFRDLPAGAVFRDLRGDKDSPDGWYLAFGDGETVVFEATRALVAAIRYYAPAVGGDVLILRY